MSKRPKIIIECKQLEELWGTEKELTEMSDKAIIELVQEDLGTLMEGAKFRVKRFR